MPAVLKLTLQEIGHNSGDVVAEETISAFDGGPLLSRAQDLMDETSMDFADALGQAMREAIATI